MLLSSLQEEFYQRGKQISDSQIQRDNEIYGIKQNTLDANKKIEETNRQILLLTNQLNEANIELRKMKEQCDLVNRQFLQYQIDEEKRSKASSSFAIISIIISVISTMIAIIALLVSFFSQ